MLNRDQKKKMQEFLKNTPERVANYRGGNNSMLDDEVLGVIETILSTGIPQKYVYTQLGIKEQTWEYWKRTGKECIKAIHDESGETKWEDLSEDRQRMCYLVYVIESSKPKVITSTWQNLRDQSKTNFRAAEMILKVLGKNDFINADHYVHHGVGVGGNEDEIIKQELAGFKAKKKEELEGDEGETS